MEGPGACEEVRTARWFSTSFRPPFISSCFAYKLHRFSLGIMDSATSAFRPFDVIFSFRTFCFFERTQRFPASVGNLSFFLAIAMLFKAI